MTWNGYIALGTSTNNVFAETTATGYARKPFTFGSQVGGRIQGAGNSITFSASSAVISTYNAFAFFSAVSGGTALLIYPLGLTYSYGKSRDVVVSPYAVVINMLDGLDGSGQPIDTNSASAITGTTAPTSGPQRTVSTSDPTTANDATQGYVPGSTWINTSNTRVWMCVSNASGAATWALDGVVPGTGVQPSSMMSQFGNGTATFAEEGNIYRMVGTGVSPGSTANDNVLAVYSMPASSFDVANRGITISAAGSFGATANNKTVKIIFAPTTAVVGSAVVGGSTVASSGATASNGGGWAISGNVFKYGAGGSNTQVCTSNGAIAGSTHLGTTAPVLATATESAAILIAITGNAATLTTDIVCNWVEINCMN